jgi:hypothetical protein
MVLRVSAIAIAVAGLVDPAIARRAAVPLPVDILMPRASDPDHRRAVRVREEIASALQGRAVLDGADAAQAVIAIGRAVLPDRLRAPLFSVPLASSPSVSIQTVRAPVAVRGQSAPIVATVRGVGLAGRTTSVALARSGTAVDHIAHDWKTDDELFEARLGFVPAGAGVYRVRVTASTSGLDEAATADLAIVTRDRRLRVLAYESRPSWPLTFVRRSLEADPLFDITGIARTTSRSATTSAGGPASLAALQADRLDAILVGAPEALSDTDARALDAFVSRRGGTLILLPDRSLTEPVRRRFGLPAGEEVVLERPLTMQPPGPSLRASELLVAPHAANGFEAVRVVRHGDRDRGVIISVVRGAGRILLSGALDAWRYRADPEAPFDTFWRGLVADAAAAAPPKLAVAIEPSIARPGDDLAVSVTLRPSELTAARGVVEVPAVAAELLATGGGGDVIRLWPGVVPGVYTARMQAPDAGEYSLSVTAAGSSADAPLLVAEDVVHPASAGSRAAAWAAETSGGAVVTDVAELATRLAALGPADVVRRTRPMRSPWWILPFAGLLCAEWALRRRSGLR